jgi:hypothetical protein
VKRIVAHVVLWLCEDVCEFFHHFDIHPDGIPGCIGNWKWWGFGPNRWLSWALDVIDGPVAPAGLTQEPESA